MRHRFPIFRRLLECSVVPGFCCASLSLLTMTGCASSGAKILAPDKKQPDPILGEVNPTPAPAYGPATPLSERQKQVPGTSASRPVDDPMFPSMPTSNAYLAARPQRLPGSETLAIADGRAPGAFQLTGGTAPIVRPLPPDPALRNGAWSATSPSTSATVSAGTFGGNASAVPSNFVDPDTALLQSRGVSDQHVEKLADGTVRVTAIVPHKDDPTLQTSYEAVGKDFATAAQLIVTKIDQKR